MNSKKEKKILNFQKKIIFFREIENIRNKKKKIFYLNMRK
jgi:hypothetical protein